MPTIFNSFEQEAMDRATRLHRTQAFIVSVSKENGHVGKYQCQVLPDLLDLENLDDCPWYPLIKGSTKKEIMREGDLVWVHVSLDLQVGFVSGKANKLADQPEERAALWETLTEGLEALEEENPVDSSVEYENTYYEEVLPGLFMFFDDTSRLIGYIDTEHGAATLYQNNKLYMKVAGTVVHTNLTLEGETHYIEGDIGILGDIDIEGDVDIDGDVEVDGDQEITGNLQVGGGDSPVTRNNEMLDILDVIETHMHTSPVGPDTPAQDSSQAPLAAQLAMLRQTLGSTTTTVD